MSQIKVFTIIIFPVIALLFLSSFMVKWADSLSPTQSFTVNSTVDATDINPGDGICETANGNETCTLRAAIMEANALAGMDEIIMPSGTFVLSLSGTNEDDSETGDLDIRDNLMINGNSMQSTIIDGAGIDSVFHVISTTAVLFQGLTIQGGDGVNGGGIYNPDGSVQVSEAHVFNNIAYGNGGGVYNSAYLTLTNSIVSSNTVTLFSGGVHNSGSMLIENSTIDRNRSVGVFGNAGGISNGGDLEVNQSSISNNTATDAGGGIFNQGVMTLTNSALIYNIADSSGGGIKSSGGSVTITNTTISHNEALSGGGIDNGGAFKINSSSIISNVALSEGGGVYQSSSLEISIENVIIAHNAPFNCSSSGDLIGLSLYNLTDDDSCGANLTQVTDVKVGFLSDNGGGTLTHPIFEDSPAVDTGNAASCPIIDQRGFTRPFGKGCDIGAFEFGDFSNTIYLPTVLSE